MVIGLLAVVACTVMFGLVVGRGVVRRLPGPLVLRRRRHLPPQPLGRPLERVVADLHRIRAEVLAPVPGASKVRRDATLAAYDDVLADACRALAVPDLLTALPAGPSARPSGCTPSGSSSRRRAESPVSVATGRRTAAQTRV